MTSLERHLADEALLIRRLAAPLLAAPQPDRLQALTLKVGRDIRARVTVIDARGRVLADTLGRAFERDAECECSIEIDPRRIEPETMSLLAELGFNRVSMGVQDFDPHVQKAVNRIQSEAVTRSAVEQARASYLTLVSAAEDLGVSSARRAAARRMLPQTQIRKYVCRPRQLVERVLQEEISGV